MSDTTNPMTTVFDMQRTAIEQTHKATVDAVDAQKAVVDAFVDGLDSFESLYDQNTEMTKNAIHAYLDAVEASVPEDAYDFDEARDLVDEQIAATSDAQKDSWHSVVEALHEGSDAFDEFADNYVELVDSSFDSYLEAHEQAEEAAEDVAEDVEIDVGA